MCVFGKCINFSNENGITSISINYYFYLLTIDAQNWQILKETEIKEARGKQAKIIGGKNQYVWLWIKNEFMVYNVVTHEKISGNKKLEEVNPFLKDNLPDGIQYIKFDDYDKSLHITSKDGVLYIIDCSNFKTLEEKEEKQIENRKREEINNVYKYGINGREITLSTNLNNRIYTILSDSELKNSYYNNRTGVNTGVNRRKLYYMYITNDIESENKWKSIEGSEFFLNGGFLLNPISLTVIQLDNTESFLIMHKKQIGEGTPVLLSKVKTDGTIVWKVELPIAHINNLIYTENKLIILSNDGKDISGSTDNNIYIVIDLLSGDYLKIDLFKNIKSSLGYYFF